MKIAELPDSSSLLDSPVALRERWLEEGVLFFRNIVSRSAIDSVRSEYLSRLKELQLVAPQDAKPVWTGRKQLDGNLARAVTDDIWQGLVSDPSFDRAIRTFLGEEPAWVPIVVHRAAPPSAQGVPADPFGGRHQDGIFNFGIDFTTCWIPLMDIDDEVGGLAVVPGSHKGSLYPPDVFRNPERRIVIPREAIPDSAWRRPNYKAGDVLMFHSMTAHAGLPNRSDTFRLSIDIRFLPESKARPFVGTVQTASTGRVAMTASSGKSGTFAIDDQTIVRGPKGHPVTGADREGILFPGAEIIVVPDASGHAQLVRSVSRKHFDLPADWFETLPAGWVS